MEILLAMLIGVLALAQYAQYRELMECLGKTRREDPYAPRERNQ